MSPSLASGRSGQLVWGRVWGDQQEAPAQGQGELPRTPWLGPPSPPLLQGLPGGWACLGGVLPGRALRGGLQPPCGQHAPAPWRRALVLGPLQGESRCFLRRLSAFTTRALNGPRTEPRGLQTRACPCTWTWKPAAGRG